MIIMLLKCSPKIAKTSLLWDLWSSVVDGDGSGEYFKFFELIVSVMDCIFSIDFFEESGIFFNSSPLLDKCLFSMDFFNLFGFKVIFAFEFCYFCEFFVDVTDLLLESPEERFILLVYDFYFIFVKFTFLWLWFF